jgi:hypothetical protein
MPLMPRTPVHAIGPLRSSDRHLQRYRPQLRGEVDELLLMLADANEVLRHDLHGLHLPGLRLLLRTRGRRECRREAVQRREEGRSAGQRDRRRFGVAGTLGCMRLQVHYTALPPSTPTHLDLHDEFLLILLEIGAVALEAANRSLDHTLLHTPEDRVQRAEEKIKVSQACVRRERAYNTGCDLQCALARARATVEVRRRAIAPAP